MLRQKTRVETSVVWKTRLSKRGVSLHTRLNSQTFRWLWHGFWFSDSRRPGCPDQGENQQLEFQSLPIFHISIRCTLQVSPGSGLNLKTLKFTRFCIFMACPPCPPQNISQIRSVKYLMPHAIFSSWIENIFRNQKVL